MKQQFKNELLTEKKCINSILRFYELASLDESKEGLNWYRDANKYCQELAARFNITVSQVAGIIAAFSPQTGWLENKRFTLTFLLSPNEFVKNKVQWEKARKILTLKSESDIYHALSLTGAAFKTKAFFLNILNPKELTEVTIDRHAIACCIQKPDNVYALSDDFGKLTRKQYLFFAGCYVKAAKKIGILPQQLQAITWTSYRRIRELREHDNDKHWQPFNVEAF